MMEPTMSRAIHKRTAITLFIAFGTIAQAADRHEPERSAAQAAAVSTQRATLKSPVDRHVAEGWSNSKKVAELICRPSALIFLKKQDKTIDRVFLGTDTPESLTLESNSLLKGSGEFRTPHGWQDFAFTCEVN